MSFPNCLKKGYSNKNILETISFNFITLDFIEILQSFINFNLC